MGAQMLTEDSNKPAAPKQMGAGKGPDATPALAKATPKRRSAAEVIADWAADLTPANSPDSAHMGPLAWVRNVKVQELVARLAQEGIK